MIAAARLPLRSDPANNQFERPSATAGSKYASGHPVLRSETSFHRCRSGYGISLARCVGRRLRTSFKQASGVDICLRHPAIS